MYDARRVRCDELWLESAPQRAGDRCCRDHCSRLVRRRCHAAHHWPAIIIEIEPPWSSSAKAKCRGENQQEQRQRRTRHSSTWMGCIQGCCGQNWWPDLNIQEILLFFLPSVQRCARSRDRGGGASTSSARAPRGSLCARHFDRERIVRFAVCVHDRFDWQVGGEHTGEIRRLWHRIRRASELQESK